MHISSSYILFFCMYFRYLKYLLHTQKKEKRCCGDGKIEQEVLLVLNFGAPPQNILINGKASLTLDQHLYSSGQV